MAAMRRGKLLFVVAYVATISALVAGLYVARNSVLATLDTPQGRANWQAWKDEAQREKKAGGPVERRPIRSDEPPALVLMRDRFAVIVAMSVLIVSFLFAFLSFALWGAFGGAKK